MSVQPSRNYGWVAVAIVVAAVALSATALSYSTFETTVTKTVSTTVTASHTIPTTSSTHPTTTVTCYQTASAPLFLMVKKDNGASIPNQSLSIQAHLLEGLVYNSTTHECEAVLSTHLWTNKTSSDGMIELGMTGDVFNITTGYLGKTYHVNADAEGAESAECVTLSLPSGLVNTSFAGTFDYRCSATNG